MHHPQSKQRAQEDTVKTACVWAWEYWGKGSGEEGAGEMALLRLFSGLLVQPPGMFLAL